MTYEMIKHYYDRKLWGKLLVKMAVQKGVITADQYKPITGETYSTTATT